MWCLAARGASVVVGVLLGTASVLACSGAEDTEDQSQAGADSSDSESGGDDGDDNSGAPGIPGGGSGGGAPGAPINIPAITDLEGLPVAEATEVMRTKIRNECGGDLCLVVEVEVQGDGQHCTYAGDPPEGTSVDRESTFVLIALCEADGAGETGTGTGTDTGGAESESTT